MPAPEHTPGRSPPRVLILGGTAEAAALAGLLAASGDGAPSVITALAGRTAQPTAIAGQVRSGGFGGAPGLAAYLRSQRIDLLIDATHPFAARISAHARVAAETAGVPRLLLWRPPWPRHPDDRWHPAADAAAAAAALPALGRRAFLTTGPGTLAAFTTVPDTWFLVRMIAPPPDPLPLPQYSVVLGRGPFDAEAEAALMQAHGIEVLVTKASGGAATLPKIAAARALGLPVLMIERPVPEAGPRVADAEAALAWIGVRLGARIEAPPVPEPMPGPGGGDAVPPGTMRNPPRP